MNMAIIGSIAAAVIVGSGIAAWRWKKQKKDEQPKEEVGSFNCDGTES